MVSAQAFISDNALMKSRSIERSLGLFLDDSTMSVYLNVGDQESGEKDPISLLQENNTES